MIYLACVLLGGGVLLAICAPLFRRDSAVESAILEETEWDLLQRKKEVILGNIQDLDFEHKCGKLSDADHERIRGELAGEFAAVLQQIDDIEKAQDLDALIRREIARRKNQPSPDVKRSCPSCGHSNPAANKFCAECGAQLKS